MRVALITGITGQDGSYLAEFLLKKGYKVYGLVRRLSTTNYERIAHILGDITLVQGDLLDQSSLSLALDTCQPDEVYNLAAMSHVGTSFEQPAATAEYNGVGVTRLLEAIRLSGGKPRFYQASTSELFGKTETFPQNEKTRFHPRSPYGVAKLYAHYSTVNYREAYGMFACCGILFNHESPRRSPEFVTRKITRGIANIYHGKQKHITLGNMKACRDWGFAGDYVEAMWLMLQQATPDDYVIATGVTHSVEEFAREACMVAGFTYFDDYVRSDPALHRPSDVDFLIGDASKAAKQLGWQPRTSFPELVAMMVESDIDNVYRATTPSHDASFQTA